MCSNGERALGFRIMFMKMSQVLSYAARIPAFLTQFFANCWPSTLTAPCDIMNGAFFFITLLSYTLFLFCLMARGDEGKKS